MARPLTDPQGSAGDRPRISTYLDAEVWKAVRIHSIETGRPTWGVVEEALREYLERYRAHGEAHR